MFSRWVQSMVTLLREVSTSDVPFVGSALSPCVSQIASPHLTVYRSSVVIASLLTCPLTAQSPRSAARYR